MVLVNVLIFALFLFFSEYSLAQNDGYQIVNSCATNSITEDFYPVKPPITGESYMRILIVYVMFNNETKECYPANLWPVNTTEGPSYKGKMLAQSKNDIPEWWNAYDQDNQMISSWFCENSRGQTHVIGDEYFVKLPYSAEEYMYSGEFNTQKERETAINNYIYDYLDNYYQVPWSNYDRWSYNSVTGWSPGPDHAIDMIYKVHRYNYYNKDYPIFLPGAFSGMSNLGYGSNTTGDFLFEMTYNSEIYRIIGCWPHGYGFAGSGLIVVGNPTSGVLDKYGALGRLIHENGHYLFGGDHSYVGMMGDVWDLSFSPYEKLMLSYATSYVSNWYNNPFEEVLLDDISGRTTNGKYLLSVKNPDREFIIANRNKVSRWDRIMNGDIAYCNENTDLGKGIYIYHNGTTNFYHPNQAIDIECADGLWKWVQSGYDVPDWNTSGNQLLPVLNRTESVKYPNDQNDDGSGKDIVNPLYQNLAKDGLTVRGECPYTPPDPIPICSKYFSKGQRSTMCGFDRIETNTDWQNWTSRENSVDRWDAWSPGYNEIFSPYSSPSTIEFGGQSSGTFIWIKERIQSYPYQTKIWIYRQKTELNPGGMELNDILTATPPSRPTGLKEIQCYYDGTYNRPRLTWDHNMEPDMRRRINGQYFKRYNIYKVKTNDMNTIPSEIGYQFISYVDIPENDIPIYTDFSEISACYLPDDAPCPPWCWIVYPMRYRVQAVDKDEMISVKSDFSQVLGMRLENGGQQGGNNDDHPKGIHNNINDIPKSFDLFQNYPNPYNPITNIKFDLPKDIFVTIKIYDMLGREIKTLVNEYKNAGSYIVSFNGSELSSGIYFYRIQAGNYVSVKRMVLIK
jgi:hypothetical protein